MTIHRLLLDFAHGLHLLGALAAGHVVVVVEHVALLAQGDVASQARVAPLVVLPVVDDEALVQEGLAAPRAALVALATQHLRCIEV